MGTFDITPDPKVLLALTHTSMQPLDALCELIDNSLDSFNAAKLQGIPTQKPLIVINLPRPSDLKRREGVLWIQDNGPGMGREVAELAIKAGYSGNNPYDSLGLFGMGFNISTGKLGCTTQLYSVREDSPTAVDVVLDLEEIARSGNYDVPFSEPPKGNKFPHGTYIQVSNWWPQGNANSDFIRKLVQYGMPTVRREIGRRYATLLKGGKLRIVINDEECVPYEHCVWADNRYVEHRALGRIYAVEHFDQGLGSQKRCITCTALVPPNLNECPACGASSFRTIEERVRGWVGIQRFDDQTRFGVDLIRNGRAIRIGEKTAFFEYVDEFKNTILDYPIDSQYGRIVGEVHLDHVPVDFLKQDFQRSSPEWQRALSFLRGDTPLQPGKIEQGKTNNSPIYNLYQGYRRVRNFGIRDLYMGYWPPDASKPQRISRQIEQEYYEKFLNREPGFYDDSEWWKLVEQADQRPQTDNMVECLDCGFQSLEGIEACSGCGRILLGKACINPECRREIVISAQVCPYCNTNQTPKVQEPWTCDICRNRNNAASDTCTVCGADRGTPNPLSEEYLLEHSNKSDDLSIEGCSVLLSDGSYSSPINVDVYIVQGTLIPYGQQSRLPLLIFKGENVSVFVDTSHSVFRTYQMLPEQMIAAEIALYLHDLNRRLAKYDAHSLSNIQWAILRDVWADRLEDNPARVQDEIATLFSQLRMRLPELLDEIAQDLFDDLSDQHKRSLVNNLLDRNLDINQLPALRETGRYLLFVSNETVVDIFKRFPGRFFDGQFWAETYTPDELPEEIISEIQSRLEETYLNCLEDALRFLKYNNPETIVVRRARSSLNYLQLKLV